MTSCLLLTAACGARLSDEQLAAATADGGGGTGAAGAQASSGSGASAGTSGSGGTTTGGSAGSAGSEATAGSGATAGSEGAEDGGTAAGGSCSPEPTDEVGVSDTEITLGNVSTITGPVAGFGVTGVNGAKAYLAMINSQGGVCGRQLTLVTADDRLDAGQNRQSASQLLGEVIGFVSNTSVVDSGVAGALEGSDVVSASLAVSDPSVQSANVFSPLPIDPTGGTQGTAPMWRYFVATRGITRVAVVHVAQADARTRAYGYLPDIEAAGLAHDVYEVSVTETNFVGVAQQIENSGADAVITALENTGIARLAQAFDQIDFLPKVPFYGSQAYGRPLLELAGPAAEGTTLGLQHAIFEDAGSNPAVAAFDEWYARVAPGSDPDFFGIIGWCAADLMVQALTGVGPAPTRPALLEFFQQTRSFDCHGFLATNDPAGKRASDQFMVVNVVGGEWVREYPASGFGPGT